MKDPRVDARPVMDWHERARQLRVWMRLITRPIAIITAGRSSFTTSFLSVRISRIRLATMRCSSLRSVQTAILSPCSSFRKYGDRWVAIAKLPNNLIGGKSNVPPAPFEQKVGRMVGDLGNVGGAFMPGIPLVPGLLDHLGNPRFPEPPFRVVIHREVSPSTAASKPIISSLPTFMPRPMPICGLMRHAGQPRSGRRGPATGPTLAGELASPCHRRMYHQVEALIHVFREPAGRRNVGCGVVEHRN